MKWLSNQLVFRSNNNFPINPYVDYPETKNEKKKEIKETSVSESNMGMNNSGINNIGSSTNVNEVEDINKEDNKDNINSNN